MNKGLVRTKEILIVVGITSILGATVLACRGTLKANDVIEEHQEKINSINEALENHSDRYFVQDIIFNSKGEAENTLSRLNDLINEYGNVTVADLYDLVDISTTMADYNYGWINLDAAKSIGSYDYRDKYMLILPPAKLLK